MRLKEEKSNWNASSIMKRDFRNSKDDIPQKHKSKKNTSKWCKGRAGVEHDWVNEVPYNNAFKFMKMDICRNCRKQSYNNVKYLNRETGEYEPSRFS